MPDKLIPLAGMGGGGFSGFCVHTYNATLETTMRYASDGSALVSEGQKTHQQVIFLNLKN